jgi:protein-S-isoprenylcysteine O-methyltransferase Ste14
MTRTPVSPLTVTLVALLLMLALHFLIPIRRVILAPYHLSGILFAVAGAAISVRAEGLFGRIGTTVNHSAQPGALVVEGPYRFSRNPMYLGLLLALIGSLLMLGTVTPALVIPAFVWVITTQVILWEEERLQATFGDAYLAYKARVRRWI